MAVALRLRLVHGYARVTDRVIYETVKQDLPLLLAAVRPLLASRPAREL
jgi:uncharacterized protein YutE (UPF0331/DUF86 family)